MTKPDGIASGAKVDVSPAAWGTREELLLAFAVNRHGTAAWDSIASEIRKRTSDSNLALTAENCRLKFVDLKRRFIAVNGDLDDDDNKSNVGESVPFLEELRKLRVAELRREVQRYDLNIESLELKVKKMEENSETDLDKRDAEHKAEAVTGIPPPAAEQSEKDQSSVNELNSTDLAGEKPRTSEKEIEPDRPVGEEVRQELVSEEPAESKPKIDHKSIRADSCNGSTNSIREPDRKDGPDTESAESEAESDGVRAKATKENSDVQSSASRSRKEDGNNKVRRGSMSGDDQSHCVKELSAAESQPFVDLLQAIRAHKLGSVLGRRLRSQEISIRDKLILQHMDLETIETRLKRGCYSGTSWPKFFRDFLLLVNNALVFFRKDSGEANAAVEIRSLIMTALSIKKTNPDSSSGKQVSSQSMLKKGGEPEPPPSNSLLLKPRISGSMIVCRKRSSIAAQNKKKELQVEEKETRSDAEEPKITKKRTRDRYPTKKNIKNNNNQASNSKNSNESKQQQQQQEQSEKKASDSKKKGAANFLSRMKQGSSSNNGVLLDALKNTPLTSEKRGGSDTKKVEKKEASSSKKAAESRQSKEKVSPAKRNVGRPPKRGAPPPPAVGKRGREKVENETPPSKPKKRARKL